MRGRTHLLIGAAVAAPFAAALVSDIPAAICLLGAGTVAALAPDVDEPHSKAGQALHVPSKRKGLFRWLHPTHWIAVVLRALLPHRGPTHWLLTGLLVAAAVGALLWHLGAPSLGLSFAIVIALAWLSHGLADLTNVKPVDILGPFCRPLRNRLGVRENSWAGRLEEWITRGACFAWMLWVGLGVIHLQASLLSLLHRV